MNQLIFDALSVIRGRLWARDRELDEQTVVNTGVRLTNRQEIVAAVAAIRSSLRIDELDIDVQCRVGEMQERMYRLRTRAAKRRQMPAK